MLKSLFVAALLASSAIACAKGGSTPAPAASSSGNPMMDAATKAIADKTGIDQPYVQLAATTAQSMLASGSDQSSAIAGGVNTAADKAEADGKPMSADQKSGLLEGLKGIIGG